MLIGSHVATLYIRPNLLRLNPPRLPKCITWAYCVRT